MSSLRIENQDNTLESAQNTAGLELKNSPYNIAVDASKNIMYSANFRSVLSL
jgi:hypothetical protein